MSNTVLEGFRLSPQQEHLWLLQQSDDERAYRAQCTIAIDGALDTQALKTALHRVVNRHDILRTSFRRLPGMAFPLQVIRDDNSAPQLPVHDLSDLQPSEQAARVQALRLEIGRQPFDLEKDPLLHLRLVRLAPDGHLLLVSLPALCMDARGLKNFLSEIAGFYADGQGGEETPEEPLRYADFADWQHEILASEETAAGRAYWRQRGLSDPGALSLPLKKPAAGSGVSDRQVLFTAIEAGLLAQAEALARRHDVSLSVLLLGCFQLVLWRLTQQSEIVTGVAAGGRNYDELESAPGLFARFLPVQARFDDDPSFAELIQEIQRATQEGLEWQEFFNWQQLCPDAPSSEDERGAPYLPFNYEFLEEDEPEVRSGGLRFRLTRAAANIARFDVLLRCLPRTDAGMIVEWYYDARLYEAAEIERLAERWQAVLANVVGRDVDRASAVNVLGAKERAQLLSDFGRGRKVEANQLCLHELFRAQVERTPYAIAVVFEDERVSYRELNRRANKFANYLRRKGVGREARVALLLERSIEMVVALLGVLKAGAAYVPLDAEYPAERLALMLEDVSPRVLVTQERLKAELADIIAAANEAAPTEAIFIDEQWAEVEKESEEEIASGVGLNNLAYVIYTSGSTGRPKGVMISHGAICNRLLWLQRAFPFTEADSILQKTSFSFDASVWEFFAPLIAGARLFIAQPGGHRDGAYLVAEIARHEITTLQLVPSMLRVLLDEPGLSDCRHLRRVFCGGEALPYDLQEKFFARMDAELNNLYGPTETAIDVTARACVSGEEPRGVLIGRPIANIQIYLLDSRSEPVPIGMAGELHVGGVGLARGYLNRPGLTAERFIPNPFSDAPGERLYRTGDLARFLSDGTIEYLGRTDHQVKLRGFRIELGEIEAVLCEQAGVRAAVVIVREDEPGRQRLVAYVLGADEVSNDGEGAAAWADQLRNALQGRLPDYMIPSSIVTLEELPRLPNGKVDRKSLPVPEQFQTQSRAACVRPRNQVEETLAGIWEEVLNLRPVGIHDNFFELGGDSILSIQIVARANQAGLKLSAKQLFRHQTIAELAAFASPASALEAPQGVLVGDVALTPIQHYFFELQSIDPHHFNQSIMLGLKRHLEAEQLQNVLEQLVLHHDALRLRFVEEGQGVWRQYYEGAEAASLVQVQRVELGAIEDAREQEAALEAAAGEIQRSLNIERGPIMRVALIEMGVERGQRLLWVVHHLAIDGVSWRILLEDLEQGLEQASRKAEVRFRAKTSSYQQWAERLEEYAQRAEIREELHYWSGAVRMAQTARLPLDYPDREVTRDSGQLVRSRLNQEETRALLQEVPAAYHTQINDVLLTALVEAVGRWSGQRRLVVEMEGHGREEIADDLDLSRTVGWFTNLYPVVLDLEGVNATGASLKQVKEQLRRIPRGGIGYGALRYLSKEPAVREQLKGARRTELSFNYLGQLDQVIDTSALFTGARERSGPQQSERGRQPYTIEVAAAVLRGELQVSWLYSEQLHRRETIERVAAEFMRALRELIAHCQSEEAGGFTPSDFPLIELNQEELDLALGEVAFS